MIKPKINLDQKTEERDSSVSAFPQCGDGNDDDVDDDKLVDDIEIGTPIEELSSSISGSDDCSSCEGSIGAHVQDTAKTMER